MGHFFDVLDGGPVRVELRSVDGRAFRLLRPVGYRSDDHPEPFEVPRDLETFRTDLASVPAVFTWLIPRTGDFLPAAVLHDGLVDGQFRGPRIDRFEADRVFRVAMAELGTGRVRSWLMWSAVTMGSMWVGRRLVDRLALVLLLGAVVALGTVATLDLVDVLDVLPWMGRASLGRELVGGAVAAAVIPAVLALLWGRRWVAGAVVGVALAFLLHVTAAIALVTGLYLLLERLVSGPRRPRPATEATILLS
ncbi:DUF1353 domain-containing protein [Georgenia wangjunii]|uniref:DUF1353 domain-containing protein n=1 Tax=Georgenia wangjunii TaxID=3117730 RepID=UPI002F25F4DC